MVAGDACCPRIFKARLMETRAHVEERYPMFRMYFLKRKPLLYLETPYVPHD